MNDPSESIDTGSTEESVYDFMQRQTKEIKTTSRTIELKPDLSRITSIKEDASWREDRSWEHVNYIYTRTDRNRTAKDSNLRGLLFLAVVAFLTFLFLSFCLSLYKSKRQCRLASNAVMHTRSGSSTPIRASLTNDDHSLTELKPSLLQPEAIQDAATKRPVGLVVPPQCPAEDQVDRAEASPPACLHIVTADCVNLLDNIECISIGQEEP